MLVIFITNVILFILNVVLFIMNNAWTWAFVIHTECGHSGTRVTLSADLMFAMKDEFTIKHFPIYRYILNMGGMAKDHVRRRGKVRNVRKDLDS